MKTGITALALAVAPALAIPPESFGFPSAPNDTALEIFFPQNATSNVRNVLVQEGEHFGINVTQSMPTLGVNTTAYRSLATYNGSYVVMMVDPDASYPNNPTSRFILHWMQGNLTQSNSSLRVGNLDMPGSRQLVNTSAPVVPFMRPSPPTNSSAHRYIVYAFQQPSNFSIPSQWSGLSASNRSRFNVTNFIRDTRLGTPAAANYFYVSNQTNVTGDFMAPATSQYPGGDGSAVTSGDPYRPTGSSGSGGSSSSSSAGAAMITGAGSLLGAGLVGLAALI